MGNSNAPQVLSGDTLSFSVAATVVTTLLQLASIEWPGAPTDFWWALWVSGAVGGFIAIYQWPKPDAAAAQPSSTGSDRGFSALWWNKGGRTTFGAVGMGLLNVLLVTAAVLGVGSAVESEPVTAPTLGAVSTSE